MLDFTYHNPTKILFGRGRHKQVGGDVSPYSRNILLHYGGGSIERSGVLDELRASLREADIRFFELGGVVPNPRVGLVREGVKLCRKEGLDFILAAGGGSVIDSAKAIAAGVPYEGDVWDFYSTDKRPEKMLPVGAVLTIPAAGSESSDGTVLTNPAGPDKSSFVSELAYPVFAVLNPQLCTTLPAAHIAAGGADILAHVMERYFTRTPGTDVSDRLCEGVMKAVITGLPRVLAAPDSYDAWAEIMWAGNLAHNGLLGRGRQEDWASHAIEHELSAQYDIAHGAGLAILMPAWMRYVWREDPARFAQFAVRVFDVPADMAEELLAQEGITRLEMFFASLGLATRLRTAGIGDDKFSLMARKVCGGKTIGSFKKLSAADVEGIFSLAQ